MHSAAPLLNFGGERMTINIIRYKQNDEEHWGTVLDEKIIPLTNSAQTLADFLQQGVEEAQLKLVTEQPSLTIQDITIMSPVTTPVSIVCQGVNYGEHRIETGMEPNRPAFNMIFNKAESSICGAFDEIIRPDHVQLLDYEIELGLVIGKPIQLDTVITEDNLAEFIAGIVISNDISARDVQISQLQWMKGKSYRTFCPVGPYLTILTKEEFAELPKLQLTLKVNGQIRQQAFVSQMLYKPLETLQELATIMDLKEGDLVMTGTPGGVAMQLAQGNMATMTSLVATQVEKQEIIERQLSLSNYLKDGDIIEATISTEDMKINLGTQRNIVNGKVLV